MNVEQILLTNICHSYHDCYGNIQVTRGKMVAMRDKIFQKSYIQNFYKIYIFRCHGNFAFTSE